MEPQPKQRLAQRRRATPERGIAAAPFKLLAAQRAARSLAQQLSFGPTGVLHGDYYTVELEPPHDTRLAVVCGGREHCGADYQGNRSSLALHAIEFVAHGQGLLEVEGKDYNLSPGTLFRYGPGVSHVIRALPGKPLVKYFVDFVGSEAEALIERAWSDAFVVQVADLHRVKARFDELSSLGAQRRPSTVRLSALALEQLMLEVGDQRWSDDRIDCASYQSYRRCRDYLEKHYLALRNLAEFAKACHLTQTYLCRVFQRYEGCSPYQRLLRLKMDYAASLLRNPSVSVKCAGLEVGFDDPYHFSKAFKQVLGVPPTSLRERS